MRFIFRQQKGEYCLLESEDVFIFFNEIKSWDLFLNDSIRKRSCICRMFEVQNISSVLNRLTTHDRISTFLGNRGPINPGDRIYNWRNLTERGHKNDKRIRFF